MYRIFDAHEVERWLSYEDCIDAVREAMRAFSVDGRVQPLREIIRLDKGGLFASMPGYDAGTGLFGAKLVSVFAVGDDRGRTRHHGVIALFDDGTGKIRALADAEAITTIRTASASAVATAELARPDACSLTIFGCGTQAKAHVHAIMRVRPIERVYVWGRNFSRSKAFAAQTARETGLRVEPIESGQEAAGAGEIICTVTCASEPILSGAWVKPGSHVNIVGSSYDGPREVDDALVARGELFVDSRRAVEAAGAEYRHAIAHGAIAGGHIRGEIGEVVAGRVIGRSGPDAITLYKSLGLIVQDLAAVERLRRRAGSRSVILETMAR